MKIRMMSLNLLPEEEKKSVKQRRIYLLLKKAGGLIFAISLIYGTLVFGAEFQLQKTINEVEQHTNQIGSNSQGYNNKVIEINQLLRTTDDMQNDYISWSCLIKDVTLALTDGISISSLALSKEKSSITILGHAAERDNLLQFKANLEKIPALETINLPLQNLLVKENFDFEIATGLKINMIKPIAKSAN
jgi:hypothetical protein